MGIFNKIEDEFYEQLGRIAWKKIKGKLEAKDFLKAGIGGIKDIFNDIEEELSEFTDEVADKIKKMN
jgi:hypothetical protein